MEAAPPFDCANCSRRIGKARGHHLNRDTREVFCVRCVDKLNLYDKVTGGSRAGIAHVLGLWPAPVPQLPTSVVKGPVDNRPHVLYRFRNRDGRLIYVGISLSLPARLGQHRGDKPWWAEVTTVTVEHFPDRASALAAEKEAIRTESPLYNVVHARRSSGLVVPDGVSIETDKVYPHLPLWEFTSRYGDRRLAHLWLYWEAHGDPISDDYYLDEITAEELWSRWVTRATPDRAAEKVFGKGAVHIGWYVEGIEVFRLGKAGTGTGLLLESAPGRDMRIEREWFRDLPPQPEDDDTSDFLKFFSWPNDAETGERLRWSALPVIDKVWRDHSLPVGPHAEKGGFIQEATGWKPSPYQPYINAWHLARLSGLPHPYFE
jgi:hypothetical protein